MITHDPRFDGHFFVAVRSTRIYCRPICRSKRPALEGCEFYRLAAAAEAAGYRPCLRCRPELAPGQAPADAADRLTAAAVERIEAQEIYLRVSAGYFTGHHSIGAHCWPFFPGAALSESNWPMTKNINEQSVSDRIRDGFLSPMIPRNPRFASRCRFR